MRSSRAPNKDPSSSGNFCRGALGCVLAGCLCLLLAACAAPQKPKPSRQGFFEQWKVMADESPGHSPPAQARALDRAPSPGIPVRRGEIAPAPEKPLPTQKVSLRMHNADIVVVLRALARAAGQNILINEKVKGAVSVDLEGVPWDQAFRGILRLNGLSYAWEGNLIRILTLEDLETEVKIQKVGIKQVEPLQLKVIPIDYSDAAKLQDKLKDYLTKDEKGNTRGSISVDEHTNSLVINAVRDDLAMLTQLVRELDKPTPQILIRSTIVEATKETALGLGVQWGGFYRSGDLFLTPGGFNGTRDGKVLNYDPATGARGISGQGFGMNYPIDLITEGFGGSLGLMYGTLGGSILDMQLSALQQDGKLNILSSPSITTLDNQVAFTENGEKVPYVSTSQLTGTEVKFEEAVLRLEIKPHVIGENFLRLEITVKKDEVDTTRQVQGNYFIIKKQTKTTLISKDGETIVISGLTKDTRSDKERGTPGLKDSSLLGWLFSSQDNKSKLEEVLIFITPHILKEHTTTAAEGSEPAAQGPISRAVPKNPAAQR